MKRPFSVTLLALGVLILASAHALRLFRALELWNFISAMVEFLPVYLVAGSLVWSTIGILLAWGLWRGQSWSVQAMKVAVFLYSLYYWLDRLLVSNTPPNNLPFAVAVNLVILLVVFWILTRQKAKVFFGAAYERRSQNSGT